MADPSHEGSFSAIRVTTRCFFSNIVLSNSKLKLARNQENATQHPKAGLLTSKNCWQVSSTLSCRNNRTYSKNKQKERACLYS